MTALRRAAPRVGALALGLAAAACTGDFGRPRPDIWSDAIAPAIGSWSAALRGEAVSSFRFTDDEDQLRDRAWRLVMPAHERNLFERQVSDLAHARILPVGAQSASVSDYKRALTSGFYASQASRYARLAGDAGSDRVLLAGFAGNASRVVAADRVRLRALEGSPLVAPGREGPAIARVVENEGLILWVCERAAFRIASYRFALANLVVETPSREAVAAERAIMALEAEAGPLCKLPLIGVFGGAGTAPLRLDGGSRGVGGAVTYKG